MDNPWPVVRLLHLMSEAEDVILIADQRTPPNAAVAQTARADLEAHLKIASNVIKARWSARTWTPRNHAEAIALATQVSDALIAVITAYGIGA